MSISNEIIINAQISSYYIININMIIWSDTHLPLSSGKIG